MTRSDILTFFEERREPWRRRDPITLAAGHAPDGVVVSPIFGTVRGRAAIEMSYRGLFSTFPDWDLSASDPMIDGNRVVEIFHVKATHVNEFLGLEGTGRPFEIHGVRIFEFTAGPLQIQHERRLYDFTGLLLQMGVLKVRPR